MMMGGPWGLWGLAVMSGGQWRGVMRPPAAGRRGVGSLWRTPPCHFGAPLPHPILAAVSVRRGT